MSESQFLELVQQMLVTIITLAMPVLGMSLSVGLLISLFQAVTQISDASLSFVPKMILVSIFIVASLPWVGDHIEAYTFELWDMIILFGKTE